MLKQQRVVIENVQPQLQCGTFFIKRTIGEEVSVTADILADGHDVMQAEIWFKHEKEVDRQQRRMKHLGNDFFEASFTTDKQGFYEYGINGWVDNALNWQHGIQAKLKDGQYVKSELLDGVQYLEQVLRHNPEEDRGYLENLIGFFQDENAYEVAIDHAASKKLHKLFLKYPERNLVSTSQTLKVYVDRKKANFSTWYEFFPRSAAPEKDKHGTFKDAEALLPRIAQMGFDVVYLPPIHPIGEVNRKGKNNTTEALEGDSGVPWGIGSRHGGHKSIHPELGTEADFKHFIEKANEHHIEIAMDLAFQAAPDHPYISSNPEWFRKRPDGTMQYAENPPKKYQDIVNFNFETTAYKALWEELRSVALYWVETFGIRIFRVDNPHTKPYYFWNWLISEVKTKHPDVLFLAEAFSRPKVMQQLAKQGFTQSYSYFTWRVHKQELIDYMVELTQTEMREYYRPNFWPNTPDINPYHLQGANEAMHLLRYALAATMSSNIGIYGPVFEYMVSDSMPGKEEYLNSEKYEVYHWDWSIKNKLTYIITKINEARHEHASLQQTWNIKFCHIENNYLIAYYKWNDDKTDETLTIINLDAHHSQNGMLQLPLETMGISRGQTITMHDVITDNEYVWASEWNYVELHTALPFHLFHIKH
ncbi:alpha-1,4-glucan--maltose-1-phosphate maltosyltransferase [Arenibacter sp. GZD96]|uniref:alpha-1,4-glucan--maltose-1-phosphate maltosyltransferase n=1 Tax=Aurantibrevibacter litoralis TaxID=3106030 RepID=UPI002B003730|nr:alpha-1,4-glucan--maltose-1-phosphate maltosyltransferase [Arenibacter sp. GZD-96]MEA1785820.1 alpha-1,4-glucan--maltose-1-phosphate maltosyltransferase [Arenibacter sp. GZD-96]